MQEHPEPTQFSKGQQKMTWSLSVGGLILFLALAMAVLFFGKSNALTSPLVDAFKVYSAVILSFLGGIRWGLVLRHPKPAGKDLIYSVLPAIAGWVAVLLPNPFSIFLLLLSFCAQGAWDSFTLGSTIVAKWFTSLRVTITFFVVLAHIMVVFAVL